MDNIMMVILIASIISFILGFSVGINFVYDMKINRSKKD